MDQKAMHSAHKNSVVVGRVKLQAKERAYLIPRDLKVDVVDRGSTDATCCTRRVLFPPCGETPCARGEECSLSGAIAHVLNRAGLDPAPLGKMGFIRRSIQAGFSDRLRVCVLFRSCESIVGPEAGEV